MVTSQYFDNYTFTSEQELFEDLIIESIRQYGVDIYYINRQLPSYDSTFNETEYSIFNNPILVEMYIQDTQGFQGDGEFLSKFGIQVTEQLVLTLANRVFENDIKPYQQKDRPQEGDLLFIPFTKSLYQIKFVNVHPFYYKFGTLETYNITCELYQGNSDKFETGIKDIDDVYNKATQDSTTYEIMAEDGSFVISEEGYYIIDESYIIDNITPFAENESFEKEGFKFINFSDSDPFSEGGRRI